ncbi:hypothetical protein KJ633_07295 [bacterium]|nr:hypothetical protein [bacterium]
MAKKLFAAVFCLLFVLISFGVSFHTHHEEPEQKVCQLCIFCKILRLIDFTGNTAPVFAMVFNFSFLILATILIVFRSNTKYFSVRAPPQIS